jgi:deaminated glutathione amidase
MAKKKDSVLSVACVQMNSGSDMKKNIADAARHIFAAAKSGATFVLLPENVAMMPENKAEWEASLYPERRHPALLAFKEIAKELGIFILAGSMGIREEGKKKAYNRSCLISAKGRIIASYDKIHLFDAMVNSKETYKESSRFAHGKKQVLGQVGKHMQLGMTVCYDLRFPQLFRALAKQGASMIAVPSAFTEVTGNAHWHVLLRARAIENGCFILAPAQTGLHPNDRKTFGHSMIINPWGEIVAEMGVQPGFIKAKINLSEVERARKRIPSLAHDRKFS